MPKPIKKTSPPVQPLPLVIECPFHEVQFDIDWAATQLDIVRHCEPFDEWKRLALCAPRNSVHCRLCHKSLRRSVENRAFNEFLLKNRQLVNITR